jgi:hypothetical protein
MHEVLAESQAGKLIFPEVVRRLLEVGVKSYFCDLARGEETFYTVDGKTHVEKMTLPPSAIAKEFSSIASWRRFVERRRTRSAIPTRERVDDRSGDRLPGVSYRPEGRLLWPQGEAAH